MATDTIHTPQGSDVEKLDISMHDDHPELKHETLDLEPLDPKAVKRLIWKCDLRVIPPLFALFLLAFMDRVNIGNANIQGLSAGLNLTGTQYNVALFIFFVPYILLEVPSNLVLKKIAPSTWLSSMMTLWGIATICQGVVKDFAGLVGTRFLLGIFEAGLLPGCVYLISMYYERYQLQWRTTIFFCGSIIAAAFGGLFAYAIANLDGVGGYAAWRWIFIIEVVVGIISKFWIVDWPDKAKFLNDEERALLARMLERDNSNAQMNRLDRKSLKRALLDWKIWCGTLIYIGIINSAYATAYFIPTIINQLGYTVQASQVRSIPVFVVAAASALIAAWFTDKLRHRYGFIMLGIAVAIVGYVILLCQNSVSVEVRYMACFFITLGSLTAQPIAIAWLSNQMGGHYKRAIGSAIQIGIGNCGGLIASNVFLRAEAPRYPTGYGTCLAFMAFAGFMSTVFFFGLRWENTKRDAGMRDYRLNDDLSEVTNMGDDHPTFRFNP